MVLKLRDPDKAWFLTAFLLKLSNKRCTILSQGPKRSRNDVQPAERSQAGKSKCLEYVYIYSYTYVL